ncbi:MAG TPA: hypothetical protein ENI05_10505 [Porticoccus sp.]|nr:hypothetical protein [Porticoccus sp.]
MRIVLSVQGSSDEPYEVEFNREGNMVVGSCTCKAGLFGQLCKHRVLLLSGDETYLPESNITEMKNKLKTLVKGSDLEAELDRVSELSGMKKEIDRELKKRKKHMAGLLNRDL